MKANIMLSINGSRDFHSSVRILQQQLDQGGIGKVTLVRVVPFTPEVVVDYPLDLTGVMAADAKKREEAESVLREVAEEISWGPVDHETVVLQGNEAETLSRFAAERHFDSVLLLTPKRSWLARLFFGNLANKILKAVCVPVTLLPSPECVAFPG